MRLCNQDGKGFQVMMRENIRIIGIATSPHREGNTELMVREALAAGTKLGGDVGVLVETDLLSLAGRRVEPCSACRMCVERRSLCVLKDDWLDVVSRITECAPDGLIFGSPVYMFNMNALGRAFMERCTSLLNPVWHPDSFPFKAPDFSRTAAGAIAVGSDRNGGVEHTLSTILHWLLLMGFVVVGGFYIGGAGWTQGMREKNAVRKDTIGLESARLVGKKVAKTAILLNSGSETLQKELPFVL